MQISGAHQGRLARAKQLAMAYAIELHSHQAGHLKQLLQCEEASGSFYDDDMTKIGKFILKYPEAAALLQHWAETGGQARHFLKECNSLIGALGYNTVDEQLMALLGSPCTVEQVIQAMDRTMRGGDWGAEHRQPGDQESGGGPHHCCHATNNNGTTAKA